MASTAASPSLTRYPRWVLALTGLTAAYATYSLWTAFVDPGTHASTNSGLQRRGAIRQQRRRSPQEQQLLANVQPSTSDDVSASPFGTITASVNNREHIYQIGPHPPTLQQLQEDFSVSDRSLRRIYSNIQHVFLDIIIERLVDSSADMLLSECGPPYTLLLPLITPLRERDIDTLLTQVDLLAEESFVTDSDSSREWRFDHHTVALAFARRCGIDVGRSGSSHAGMDVDRTRSINLGLDAASGGLEHDLAETVIDSESGATAREPGQGIKGLLYTIAEEQAKRSAYIHRGTRCDSCGEFPIKGVRWHCINCPDYDLCSACESQTPSVHPRTHVFAKIKIPISTLAQPHEVHDLWYPGDPLRHWPPLEIGLRKRLVSETGFEDVVLDALYEQFTCIANVAFPADTTDIKAAIDRRAFNRAMSSDNWPAPLEPNFLYDRMFAFYDTDNNSLIAFEEFVHGLAYLRQPLPNGKRKDMKRLIKGYDVDGDGLVCRADFVRMFAAKYTVQRHIIRDVIAAEEAEIVAHTGDVVRSSQPISAAFTGEDVPYGEQRVPLMKRPDEFGEMQAAEGGLVGCVTLPDTGEVWDWATVNAVATRYGRPNDLVSDRGPFTLGQAEEVRNRYSRVEGVALPQATEEEQNATGMVLVETDSRWNRGRADLEPARVRWRTDLNDALAGGAAISSSTTLRDNQDTGYNLAAQNGDAFRHSEGEKAHGEVEAGSEKEAEPEPKPEPSFPDFIFSRNQSFPIPATEFVHTQAVLYQVMQEGINELLDPLFQEPEALAQDVRATRVERRRWRKEIDGFLAEKDRLRSEELRLREELRTGSEIDPLLGTAFGEVERSEEWRRPDRSHGRRSSDFASMSPVQGEDASRDRPLHDEDDDLDIRRSAHPSPQGGQGQDMDQSDEIDLPPHEQDSQPGMGQEDIAAQIRHQMQRENEMLPTDDEGLEDLEFNIRQQPLDELLAATGYSLSSPIEERSHNSWQDPGNMDGLRHDNNLDDQSGEEYREEGREDNSQDPTLPQNMPFALPTAMPTSAEPRTAEEIEREEAVQDAHREEESMHVSPSSPPSPSHLTLPASFQPPSSSIEAFIHNVPSSIPRAHDSSHPPSPPKDDLPPSSTRLAYLHRLDVEERRILERGGPARLDYEEVEEICRRDGNQVLLGLVGGWSEWAGF